MIEGPLGVGAWWSGRLLNLVGQQPTSPLHFFGLMSERLLFAGSPNNSLNGFATAWTLLLPILRLTTSFPRRFNPQPACQTFLLCEHSLPHRERPSTPPSAPAPCHPAAWPKHDTITSFSRLAPKLIIWSAVPAYWFERGIHHGSTKENHQRN